MPIEGVDYAWDRPNIKQLAAAGIKFACRYGGPGSDGKQLHADELAALRAAGIDVVANAEGTAAGFKGTAAGVSWAQSAISHFNALGMPAGRPIYFSVDWDAISTDWAAIDAALRGAASVIGAARVGVYGSYATVEHCRKAGTARWFWQTYAWSNGVWSPYAHLQQYRNGVQLAGADLDRTRAMVADYGQWGYAQGDDMDKNEFLGLLKDNDVRQALCRAVLYTDGVLPSPPGAAPNTDGTPNAEWTGWGYLTNTYAAAVSARGYAATAANVKAFSDAVIAGIAAALPEATGGLSSEQVMTAVQAGVRAEFARAFGGPAT